MGASFHTLERENYFRNPPADKPLYPLLNAAVEPHVESFNALFDGPDGGLLNLGVKDIGTKAVFDSTSTEYLGNKLSCMFNGKLKFTYMYIKTSLTNNRDILLYIYFRSY